MSFFFTSGHEILTWQSKRFQLCRVGLHLNNESFFFSSGHETLTIQMISTLQAPLINDYIFFSSGQETLATKNDFYKLYRADLH